MIKSFLKSIQLYHPLQTLYRSVIFDFQKRRYQKKYKRFEGRGYTCNVCGSKYEQFVADHPSEENKTALEVNDVIAGYGENILCPHCMSTARERLIIAYLQKEVDLNNKQILHLSPEKNIYRYITKKAKVTTADLSPGFYRRIDSTVQKQNATCLTYSDEQFDLIIANHILEHIPDDRKAMAEFYRVLKFTGIAILQVPYSERLAATIEEPGINNPVRQSHLFGQKDHVRIYQLTDYIRRLREVGFDVIVLSDELETFMQYAIQPKEKLLIIRKTTS